MSDRFDLENAIMRCWLLLDDLEETTCHFVDDPKWTNKCGDAEYQDELMNQYLGLKKTYELKFQKVWDIFTELVEKRDIK